MYYRRAEKEWTKGELKRYILSLKGSAKNQTPNLLFIYWPRTFVWGFWYNIVNDIKGGASMGYSDIKEMLKDARNLATGANDLQLLSKLLEIQAVVFDLYDENRELRLQLEEVERNNQIGSELEYKEESYFRNGEGPYCTRCWDVDNKLVRKKATTIGMEMRQGKYKCLNCKQIS